MKTWTDFFNIEKEKPYFKELMNFVDSEYKNKKINPKKEDIFKAFSYTKLEDVKVVILGQDPYPTNDYACGLAFSVKEDSKLPKSLVNIFKELTSDTGIIKENGDLSSWAKNGVLLLNTILTCEENYPLSHKNKGWEILTDNIIKHLNTINRKIVFILWGSPAIKKAELLNNSNHLIIKTPHPSPLSAYRGFFGSKVFSRTCSYLGIDYNIWK